MTHWSRIQKWKILMNTNQKRAYERGQMKNKHQ